MLLRVILTTIFLLVWSYSNMVGDYETCDPLCTLFFGWPFSFAAVESASSGRWITSYIGSIKCNILIFLLDFGFLVFVLYVIWRLFDIKLSVKGILWILCVIAGALSGALQFCTHLELFRRGSIYSYVNDNLSWLEWVRYSAPTVIDLLIYQLQGITLGLLIGFISIKIISAGAAASHDPVGSKNSTDGLSREDCDWNQLSVCEFGSMTEEISDRFERFRLNFSMFAQQRLPVIWNCPLVSASFKPPAGTTSATP